MNDNEEMAKLIASSICNDTHVNVSGGKEELLPLIATMLANNIMPTQIKYIIEKVIKISLERVDV